MAACRMIDVVAGRVRGQQPGCVASPCLPLPVGLVAWWFLVFKLLVSWRQGALVACCGLWATCHSMYANLGGHVNAVLSTDCSSGLKHSRNSIPPSPRPGPALSGTKEKPVHSEFSRRLQGNVAVQLQCGPHCDGHPPQDVMIMCVPGCVPH